MRDGQPEYTGRSPWKCVGPACSAWASGVDGVVAHLSMSAPLILPWAPRDLETCPPPSRESHQMPPLRTAGASDGYSLAFITGDPERGSARPGQSVDELRGGRPVGPHKLEKSVD